jgi:hypothetical protein
MSSHVLSCPLNPLKVLPEGIPDCFCRPPAEERYILQGQRMAWEKAHEIRIMMLLEADTEQDGP